MLQANNSLRELMGKYGPRLVSSFSVSRHFQNGGTRNPDNQIGYIQFTGKDIERAKGKFVRLDGGKFDEDNVEVELEQYLEGQSDPKKKLFAVPPTDQRSHDGPGSSGQVAASTQRDAAKKKSVEGKHSMVLLGGRHGASENKDYFLLQNWWSAMQLVEVDVDYLEKSGASLYFVKPERFDRVSEVNLEECYSMNRYMVAEAYNLDRADTKHGCFNRTPRERN
ncbi:expressed unknown protein [Seminavis robusta]|uniref:Uncharacterized protein n=1 Tax=Seminavis robusta TaxID=568900 RepID=A0A9N8HHQ8_9STRA|nr:expressed unknown protein [Seminavis robusta]|eukprot:Sro460_g147550.1 n/a (223) ;mRNA; f:38990-39658